MDDLCRLGVVEIQNLIENGQVSSREATEAFLERIERIDKSVKAYLTINQRAVDDADEADRLRVGGTKKPLLGVPMAIKDNFLTKGLRTTASSKVLGSYIPQYDATVIKRLREAGAVILGKTNMDAWAHGSSTETSDYGPTFNPWDLSKLPGGSSGGSAAAVVSDMCAGAVGSETAGSIRQPAAWCGVTGFKPSYGRVSRYGVIAMASSTDSPGVLSKNVEDAALVGQTIAGFDRYDATSSDLAVSDWVKVVDARDLSGVRVGVAIDYLLPQMRNEVKDLIMKAAEKMRELGAKVTEVRLIDPNYSVGVYTIIQRSEVSSNLARYDGIRFGNDRSYFGQEAKRRIMLGTYTLSAGYYDQFYNKAVKVRTLIVDDFKRAFKEVDVIIGPTSPGPALPVGSSLDQPMFGEMEDILVEPSSIAGLTGINVPCGFLDGLPIGLQIIGPQFREEDVLKCSCIYQKHTQWHKLKPSI